MTASRKNLLVTVSPTPYSAPLLQTMVPSPLDAYVGIAVSGCALVGSGGSGSGYTFTMVTGTGTPPEPAAGLTLNTDGTITGTPTAQGVVEFVAQVQDSASETFEHAFTINVQSGLFVVIGGGALPTAYKGTSYRFGFLVEDATGSSAGITYAVHSGSLPASLSLSSAGVLSGTPSAVGVSYFTVRATKSSVYIDIPCSLTVNTGLSGGTASVTIPDALRYMTVGTPVAGQLVFNDAGTATAVTWAITSGALPAGLTMNSSGYVKGTPTTPTGTSYTQPTITLTDRNGATATFTPSGSNVFGVRSSLPSATSGHFWVADSTTGDPTSIDFISQYFGDGSDGDIVVSSGSYTVADSGVLYANNLTLSGTGYLLFPNNTDCVVYVAGVLDIANAAAGAIATPAGGGTPFGTPGGTAGAGGTGIGGNGGNTNNLDYSGGGEAGIGGGGGTVGEGGNGSSGVGGVSGVSGSAGFSALPRSFLTNDIVQNAVLGVPVVSPVMGGVGGGGGGGGGGNGAIAGGAGGHGGDGGGRIRVYARTINRGSSTAAGAISANGNDGSNGTAGSGSGRGGGGGGIGGGGGYVRVVFGNLTGSTATGAITCNGGKGGNGGNSGGGLGATAGKGGSGGHGGNIILNDLLSPTTTLVVGSAGSVNSGQTGGAAGTCSSDL